VISTDTTDLVNVLNTRLEILGLSLKADTTEEGILQQVAFIASKMDDSNLGKLARIPSAKLLDRIAEAIELTGPAKIFIDMGATDKAAIRQAAIDSGEETAMTQEGHTYHMDPVKEQGRIVANTYYIKDEGSNLSALAKGMDRADAVKEIRNGMTNIMNGRTMYISLYTRGPKGFPLSFPVVQMTDSAYVAHSAGILYRNDFEGFFEQMDLTDTYFTNLHSTGTLDTEKGRIFMDLKKETTIAFEVSYAGNALLMKKGHHRLAVNRAVKRAIEEGEFDTLSEHMFITGVKGPKDTDRMTWIVGAAPSGCGKTTTAMAGDQFIGDDLAQFLLVDNMLAVVNPECGIFGIVKDMTAESDPNIINLLKTPGKEAIFSNVLITPEGEARWTNDGRPIPEEGINFQGNWTKSMLPDTPISHGNARVTLNSEDIANFANTKAQASTGVEAKIITYSGRDPDTMPPVWIANSANEGVLIGANIVSATTATEVGADGSLKRAPWANAPFVPSELGAYMQSQFGVFNNEKLKEKPLMAGLNYFLTDKARGGESDKLLGEKQDVKVWLAWLERFKHGEAEAIDTPIGKIPTYEKLKDLFSELIDKNYTKSLYDKQFSLYLGNIISRLEYQMEEYGKIKSSQKIPDLYFTELQTQIDKLNRLQAEYGDVITSDQLLAIAQ